MLYYAAFTLLALLLFLRRRPGGRMRLRLRWRSQKSVSADERLQGQQPPQSAQNQPAYSRVERPLNVVFNYNGHSWDAYEVLGLPAGSAPEKVEAAFAMSMDSVDAGSRPFLEAAYRAIQSEWQVFKVSSE